MNPPEHFDIDLGERHWLRFTCWKPDRTLNPQYANLPDIEKLGAIIYHGTPHGEDCSGSIYFDLPIVHQVFGGKHKWRVDAWEPLTLSPSVLCACGDHGFICGGRWVRA